MQDPPQSIFGDITSSYDSSICFYFKILKWNTILMLLFALLNVPNLIFCVTGGVLPTFSFESLTLANIDLKDLNFLVAIICDLLGCLFYIAAIAYLRYKENDTQKVNQVISIAPWSVEISGFPSATIDPEDLRPMILANTYEIYLVRNFQGTLELMKQKATVERLIRLENKKLEIYSKKLTQAEMYIRQDYIRLLKIQVQDRVKELGEKFNLFLAPEDLESIRAYVVFKNKHDRDQFYERYNNDCLLRNEIYLCHKQSIDLQLRNLYTIRVKSAPDPSEIKWENMDFVQKDKSVQLCLQFAIVIILLIPLIVLENIQVRQYKDDPLICQKTYNSNCLSSEFDFLRFLTIVAVGAWILMGNYLGNFVLQIIIAKERQIYKVKEQLNIQWRLVIFLFINTFIFPILLGYQFMGDILFVFSSFTDSEKQIIYSSDSDRKSIINHLMFYLWISIGYTIIYLITIFTSRCLQGIEQDTEDLQVIGGILADESMEDERQKQKMQTQNNQSHQTLFLLNLDESNQNNYSHQNLDCKESKPLRRDSQIINKNEQFYTGYRLAKLTIITGLGLLLSPAIPVLPSLCFIQLCSIYYSDKYMLLHFHSYNEQQQIKLQNQYKKQCVLFLKTLHFIIILHLIVALQFYGSPQFYIQSGLGLSAKWEDYTLKYLYKLATILPITIFLALLLLTFIVDIVYFRLIDNSNIGSEQVSQELSQNVTDHLTTLKSQGALISYNLKYHDEFKEIIQSQKQESIRATLNQFKH